MDVRVFEEALAGVAIGWDEYVQSEVDRARGKTPAITWTDEDGRDHTCTWISERDCRRSVALSLI